MPRAGPRVEIRALKSHAEFRQCERIQKEVWGTLAASSELLSVTQKYGGAVLGAMMKDRVVGFVYAFLARHHGRLVHWSHMMAVQARYRDLGLGFRMKLAHRRLALKQGIEAICWTYDPLQSRNAFLNIARLGGRVSEYLPDCYGHFPSVIEKGLASDRLVVEWNIASRAVERRLRQRDRQSPARSAPSVNQTQASAPGLIENRSMAFGLRGPRLLVEIPPNTDAMRSKALGLARRWRRETRRIFQHYFLLGYRVEDFIPPCSSTDGRCFYVLSRTKT
jgi:predicted GNAT superfamily acetyltransferase